MTLKLNQYLRAQIQEINSDPILRRFAVALIFVHLLTAIFWYYQGFIDILRDPVQSYCWPLFPGCDGLKQVLGPFSLFLFLFYVVTAFAGLFFSLQSSVKSWFALFALEILKLAYGFLDYRFMGNYHFMPHIVTLVFLFVPQKRFWIRTWIVTFYFAAATLKFNLEWLSGASMSWKVPFNSTRVLEALAFLALFVELSAPQLLLFPQRSVRGLGLILLAAFHGASYYWVGFFYPGVMFSLLSFFLLELVISQPTAEPVGPKTRAFLVVSLFWMSFVVVQLVAMNNARDFALRGEKRLWSLNMFDARAVCRGFFLIHKQKEVVEVDFKNDELAVRVQCDDLIFLEQARHLCKHQTPDTKRIEAYLSSRLFSDSEMMSIIRDEDVCQRW